MSVPFGRAVLTLADIAKQIRRTFEQFTDPRRGKNTRYTLVDAGLSAFSVFFMQSPSFLEYQRSLDQRLGKNNAQTLFGVHQIPSDNQIRHLLDATEPGQVKAISDKDFTHHAGRTKMSHLGSRGLRSNRASTSCIAFLESEMPFW